MIVCEISNVTLQLFGPFISYGENEAMSIRPLVCLKHPMCSKGTLECHVFKQFFNSTLFKCFF
jgi:hypothetical protein